MIKEEHTVCSDLLSLDDSFNVNISCFKSLIKPLHFKFFFSVLVSFFYCYNYYYYDYYYYCMVALVQYIYPHVQFSSHCTGVNGNKIITLESKRATAIASRKALQIGKGWSKLLGKISDVGEQRTCFIQSQKLFITVIEAVLREVELYILFLFSKSRPPYQVYSYRYVCGPKKSLNSILAIDLPFQTSVVGLLVVFIDLLYHCFLQKRFLRHVN